MSISQKEQSILILRKFDERDTEKEGLIEGREITKLVGAVFEALNIPLPSNEAILAQFDIKETKGMLSRLRFLQVVEDLIRESTHPEE